MLYIFNSCHFDISLKEGSNGQEGDLEALVTFKISLFRQGLHDRVVISSFRLFRISQGYQAYQ